MTGMLLKSFFFSSRFLFALGSALSSTVYPAGAESYPQRPVRVVVNVSAGGGVDSIARVMAQHYAGLWGQPFVVDNRTGGGGSIGVDTAVKAAPDGYTILVSSSSVVTNAAVARQGYDPVRDLLPITRLTSSPYIVAVGPSIQVSSVKDLVALAKGRPDKVSFASAGTGSITHMGAELLTLVAGAPMLHVPYKGVADAYPAVVSGQVDWVLGNPVSVLAFIKAGRLKGIAVTSTTRLSALPQIPTVAESGVPGYEVAGWYGMFAPVNVPPEIIAKLNSEARKKLQSPEIARRMEIEVSEAVGNSSKEFTAEVKAELQKWRELVAKRGIKL
jgi:tripartite-type tricarboxylate transporter receptor subunit TctC